MKARPVISVLIDHPRLIDRRFLRNLGTLGKIRYRPAFRTWDKDRQRSLLKSTDIAVTGWGPCMLPLPLSDEKPRRLKYICHMTGEMKRVIPLEYLKTGIRVTNWGKSLSFATAEGTLALLLTVLKNITGLDTNTRRTGHAGWQARPFLTLRGTRVGLYGLSSIGQITARLLRPFGPNISFYDPTVRTYPGYLRRLPSLQALFRQNSIVLVHAGLNDATRHSITYRELSMLPKGAIFINTARGAIVKEKDLARILRQKRISAGIEVIEDEADWRKSPLIKAPNAVLTGHVIARTAAVEKQILQTTAIENIQAFIAQRPLKYRITPNRYRIMT